MKEKKLVALEVTDERTGDSKMFKDLIEQTESNLGKGKIKRVLADIVHDSRENFNLSEQKGN